MPRLTVESLKRTREEAKRARKVISGQARAKVTVHMSTCGIAAGAREVMAGLVAELDRLKVTDVIAASSSCAGLCSREPMATVEIAGQAPVKYGDLTPEKMVTVIRRHVLGGNVVTEFALAAGCETTG
jgi:NADP-reducing hydrogenase subunit HndB